MNLKELIDQLESIRQQVGDDVPVVYDTTCPITIVSLRTIRSWANSTEYVEQRVNVGNTQPKP